MGLSPRYLVSRGGGKCGRKELWENGPSAYQRAGDLIPEAGLTSNVGRKIQNWMNIPWKCMTVLMQLLPLSVSSKLPIW
jgi:hypothetical protein